MRKGNINTLTKKGEKKFIYDVCFVPLLKHNLMSIGQLLQKGYRIFFKRKQCTILHKFPSIQLMAKVQIPKVKTRFEGRIGSKTPFNKITRGWRENYNTHSSNLSRKNETCKLVMASKIWTPKLWTFKLILQEKNGKGVTTNRKTR